MAKITSLLLIPNNNYALYNYYYDDCFSSVEKGLDQPPKGLAFSSSDSDFLCCRLDLRTLPCRDRLQLQGVGMELILSQLAMSSLFPG